MIDKITSIFENYSTKIKNPFFGTIISVWLIHNWRIPYALFNFDKECSLTDKINFIADYFGKQYFWDEFTNIIGLSFLVLLCSFILLLISRAITDTYYKIIEPYIVTKIDKKAIFTQAEKQDLEDKILKLETALNNKREEITRAEGNTQIIQQKRDVVQSEYNSYIESSGLEYKNLQEKMDQLVSRTLFTEKVTDFYEDVIVLLNEDEKTALRYIIDRDENITGDVYTDTLNEAFSRHGFLDIGSVRKINQNGRFFVEYYRKKISAA